MAQRQICWKPLTRWLCSRLVIATVLHLVLGYSVARSQSPASVSLGDDDADTGHSSTSRVLSFDYTGALYGYYRIEPDDHDASGDLIPPNDFLHGTHPNSLLLGMGDN